MSDHKWRSRTCFSSRQLQFALYLVRWALSPLFLLHFISEETFRYLMIPKMSWVNQHIILRRKWRKSEIRNTRVKIIGISVLEENRRRGEERKGTLCSLLSPGSEQRHGEAKDAHKPTVCPFFFLPFFSTTFIYTMNSKFLSLKSLWDSPCQEWSPHNLRKYKDWLCFFKLLILPSPALLFGEFLTQSLITCIYLYNEAIWIYTSRSHAKCRRMTVEGVQRITERRGAVLGEWNLLVSAPHIIAKKGNASFGLLSRPRFDLLPDSRQEWVKLIVHLTSKKWVYRLQWEQCL